jgi:hypothetical protein
MAYEYDNLDWTIGADNPPGIYPDVYFIRKSDISAWPTLESNPATVSGLAKYVGDFTLADASTWNKLFADVDKSPVNSEPQGEKFSRSYMNTCTIKYPGTKAEAIAFARAAANDDLVFIVREKATGNYRVIGSEMFQCDVNISQNIGGSPTDDRGTTIEIAVTDKMPPPIYEGSIVTDEGDVNPSS